MTNGTEQLEFERDCWNRLVDFIMFETAYLKTRLAEVIRLNKGDDGFLNKAEFYQDYYLKQDERLSLLKRDLRMFNRLIEDRKKKDGAVVMQLQDVRQHLRIEMEKLEAEFCKGRKVFADFIDSNL
jgi:hypothetical protein